MTQAILNLSDGHIIFLSVLFMCNVMFVSCIWKCHVFLHKKYVKNVMRNL